MFEFWAEKIRQQLAALNWVSRSAGLVEVLSTTDGKAVRFPAAPKYDGAECLEGEDYVRVAPHDGESAIAFVTTTGEMNPMRPGNGDLNFYTNMSVVVWFDTRRVGVPEGEDLGFNLSAQVIQAVMSANLNQTGAKVHKVKFTGMRHNAKSIWGPLGLTDETLNLFTLPYRTFEVQFKVWAGVVPVCLTADITTTEC